MNDERRGDIEQADEAQVAIRDGIERARELVCEAKLVMRQQDKMPVQPRNQAS